MKNFDDLYGSEDVIIRDIPVTSPNELVDAIKDLTVAIRSCDLKICALLDAIKDDELPF